MRFFFCFRFSSDTESADVRPNKETGSSGLGGGSKRKIPPINFTFLRRHKDKVAHEEDNVTIQMNIDDENVEDMKNNDKDANKVVQVATPLEKQQQKQQQHLQEQEKQQQQNKTNNDNKDNVNVNVNDDVGNNKDDALVYAELDLVSQNLRPIVKNDDEKTEYAEIVYTQNDSNKVDNDNVDDGTKTKKNVDDKDKKK